MDRDVAEQARGITDLAAEIVRDITEGTLQTGRGVRNVVADFENQCVELLAMCLRDPEEE